MRSSLLLAAVAGMMASTPATAFAKPRSNPQPRRLYTSADDDRKSMADLAKTTCTFATPAAIRCASKEASMALSRPIGWLRDQRGDAVGLATADPLFQGGETKPTGYVATYSPVFTAEQVQQEIKEASMALSDRDCRHGRQIGECADCALDHMEMAADAEARSVDELTALRKQDTELIRQMLDALDGAIAITMGKIDLRNAAIAAARERLESKP